jgi:8-oxo-dGTP diphosphatase
MPAKHFNVRVYGILIDEKKRVLVCDELIKGHEITKFPGGGLEHGEGTIECIQREFIEETGNEIEVTEHFYTTDFYQQSAYNVNHQTSAFIISLNPKEIFKSKQRKTFLIF